MTEYQRFESGGYRFVTTYGLLAGRLSWFIDVIDVIHGGRTVLTRILPMEFASCDGFDAQELVRLEETTAEMLVCLGLEQGV